LTMKLLLTLLWILWPTLCAVAPTIKKGSAAPAEKAAMLGSAELGSKAAFAASAKRGAEAQGAANRAKSAPRAAAPAASSFSTFGEALRASEPSSLAGVSWARAMARRSVESSSAASAGARASTAIPARSQL
jgi:hypothetical protein